MKNGSVMIRPSSGDAKCLCMHAHKHTLSHTQRRVSKHTLLTLSGSRLLLCRMHSSLLLLLHLLLTCLHFSSLLSSYLSAEPLPHSPPSSSWSASQGSCSNSALFLQPTLLRSNPSLLWVRVKASRSSPHRSSHLPWSPLLCVDLFFSPLI